MHALFCADPLAPRQVDGPFLAEADAARAAGWSVGRVDFEALVRGAPVAEALLGIGAPESPSLAVYRGWMLRPAQYQRLAEGLAARGLTLVNTPEAYAHCHHLPGWYALAEGLTPRSVWTREVGPGAEAEWMRLLAPFGDAPVLVKDFVKSRKHEWAEACFIPSASDAAAVSRVARRLLALQGEDLNEGLVFREFVRFVPLEAHPRSGMPRVREFRAFVLDGEPLVAVPYWDDVDRADAAPLLAPLAPLLRQVRSRFFTVDVAQREDGRWLVVELGDGQVSGLPERVDLGAFFTALRGRLAPGP
jgi:hypothetical protein